MDSWAFNAGQIGADGYNVEKTATNDDKYWQKYMSDTSPYREKFSPPAIAKSPDRGKSPKRRRGKKKPRWMTNEEYERLLTKSYAKKNTGDGTAKEEDSYFNNGGEVLRWPEVLQQRPHSPALKHASKQVASKHRTETEDSNLEELNILPGETMKGTYRPSSAPLGKGKGLFTNDLLLATPQATKRGRQSRDVSPSGRKLKLDEPCAEGTVDEDGIMEYGDTYVIENEEEAIRRVQEAMIAAVEGRDTSPPRGRSRAGHKQRATAEEQEKKIGAGLYVSGMCNVPNCCVHSC
jgi:hypothetical protein